MKRIAIICLLATVSISLLCGCTSENQPTDSIVANGSEVESLYDANTKFAFDIFRVLNKEDAQENVFVSPLSISTALTMAYNGAHSSTQAAMKKALSLSEIEINDVLNGYSSLLDHLQNLDSDITMNIANSIWYRQGMNVQSDFLVTNGNYFGANISELDFSQETAASTINKWISDATQKKINKMVSSPIPDDVLMYLINAIYFEGKWAEPFDKNLTCNAQFEAGDGEKLTVKMMTKRETLMYGTDQDYAAVRIPYGKNETAMYCILPSKEVEINEFIDTLSMKKWNSICSSLFETDDLVLRLPRFKIEYGIKSLNSALMNLGMAEAFGPNADFSGIAEDMCISQVLHKAIVEVDEEGSEAAGVTTVIMYGTCAPKEPICFEANRPFFFLIVDDSTNTILFMGKAYHLDYETNQ